MLFLGPGKAIEFEDGNPDLVRREAEDEGQQVENEQSQQNVLDETDWKNVLKEQKDNWDNVLQEKAKEEMVPEEKAKENLPLQQLDKEILTFEDQPEEPKNAIEKEKISGEKENFLPLPMEKVSSKIRCSFEN